TLVKVYATTVPKMRNFPTTEMARCHEFLRRNLATDDPDLPGMAGAVACIDLLLEEFDDWYAAPQHRERLEQLYGFLLKIITSAQKKENGSGDDGGGGGGGSGRDGGRDGAGKRAGKATCGSGMTRYALPAKALRLLRHHAMLFRDILGPAKVRQLLPELVIFYHRKTKKLLKHAIPVLHTVLDTVGDALCGGGVHWGGDAARKLFADLMEGWLTTLEISSSTDGGNIQVAIAGVSALAPAIVRLQTAREGRVLRDKLLVCTERAVAAAAAIEDDEDIVSGSGGAVGNPNAAAVDKYHDRQQRCKLLKTQSDLLVALACVVQSVGVLEQTERDAGTHATTGPAATGPAAADGPAAGVEPPDYVLRRLETLALDLLVGYTELKPRERHLPARALSQLFLALAGPGQGDALARVVGRIAAAGVARAAVREEIDETTWTAGTDPETGEPDERLCFPYADLWKDVLRPSGPAELRALAGMHYADAVPPLVAGQLLAELSAAFGRLDLSYDICGDGSGGGGGGEGDGAALVARMPMDQEIMLNLVVFCELVMPQFPPAPVAAWLTVLVRAIVGGSLRHPHVSSQYRLLALLFREAERTEFFRVLSAPPGGGGGGGGDGNGGGDGFADGVNAMKVEGEGGEDVAAGGDGGFMAEAVALRRVLRRYVDHITMQTAQFSDELLVMCCQMLLQMPSGRGLEPLIPALLATLRAGTTHLQTAGFAIDALERWQEQDALALDALLPAILPSLDPYLYFGGAAGRITAAALAEEGRRDELRLRVLRLLGRLGGRNHCLAANADEAVRGSLAWDITPRLELSVPFHDFPSLPLLLDSLLPRVVELAGGGSSGTEQTKTLASEFLHAVVIYMVSKTASDPRRGITGHAGQFSLLFRRIFPALLRLAVDVEPVTRRLFERLVLQLARWFSNAAARNEDAIVLLDCLCDGLASKPAGGGGAVRSLSARGVAEYLRYAVKQTGGPIAVDALLIRLYSMLNHPDRHRRLGGAVAFNEFYMHLREETPLVKRYALQLLHAALSSVRRAHCDHTALGVADAAARLVDHGLRIVVHSVVRGADSADLLVEVR
ncbi:unnamed protein product, partial [Phaeothamnion confervicola]